MDITVDTLWLSRNLNAVKVLDASWYLPTETRNCTAEFTTQHIQGAQFFDIDLIADHSTDLPHMLPSAETFADAVGALGISNSDTVIVYDTAGLFSAARVWWMFKVMGHQNVAVLDGGMPKWVRDGFGVADQQSIPTPSQYHAVLNTNAVVDWAAVLNTTAQILDARPAPRFHGEAAEPRPNTRSGHIPNSLNLFFKNVLTDQGELKSKEQLNAIVTDLNLDINQPIITSCGSGVTAAILAMALERLGARKHALYDGSWSEWGARNDLPISTG